MATPHCDIEVLDFTKDLTLDKFNRLTYFRYLENEESVYFDAAAHLLPFNSIFGKDLKPAIFYIALMKDYNKLCGVAELEIEDGYLILKSLVTVNAKTSAKERPKLYFGPVGTNILNRIIDDYKNETSIKGIKVSDPLETAVVFYIKRGFKENEDDELEYLFRTGDGGHRKMSLKRRKKKSVKKRKSKTKSKSKRKLK